MEHRSHHGNLYGTALLGQMLGHQGLIAITAIYWAPTVHWGFPGGSDGKESTCNAGDLGLIPGLGRSPGEGNGKPLRDSCLENPLDRGAWQPTAHRAAKSQTQLPKHTLSTHNLLGFYDCFHSSSYNLWISIICIWQKKELILKFLIIWPLGLLVNGRNMNTGLLITDYNVSSSFLGEAIKTDNKTNIY